MAEVAVYDQPSGFGIDSKRVKNSSMGTNIMEKRYKCLVEGCNKSFGRPSRLEQHSHVHTGKRPFKCQQCERSYTRPTHLKRHVESSHEIVLPIVFRCPVDGCSRQFTSQSNLRRHHDSKHVSPAYSCPDCGKCFKKHQQLKIHQYQHTGIKPFMCQHEGCDKSFLLPSKLKNHMKVHAGYNCDFPDCSQHFTSWSLLRKHKAETHKKVYQCNNCDKVFQLKSLLIAHLETHKDERELFHCPFEDCERWYYFKKNLNQHIQKIHEGTSYECKVEGCGKVLYWKASFITHMRRHELGTKKRKAPKSKKPRSDKGSVKKAIAVILSGYPATSEENANLIRNVE